MNLYSPLDQEQLDNPGASWEIGHHPLLPESRCRDSLLDHAGLWPLKTLDRQRTFTNAAPLTRRQGETKLEAEAKPWPSTAKTETVDQKAKTKDSGQGLQ